MEVIPGLLLLLLLLLLFYHLYSGIIHRYEKCRIFLKICSCVGLTICCFDSFRDKKGLFYYIKMEVIPGLLLLFYHLYA